MLEMLSRRSVLCACVESFEAQARCAVDGQTEVVELLLLFCHRGACSVRQLRHCMHPVAVHHTQPARFLFCLDMQ
jgi:hypothetical protein